MTARSVLGRPAFPDGAPDGSLDVTPALFLGFAIASIGGPIALLTLLPGAAGEELHAAGLVVILALALFSAPVAVWFVYSGRVVSPGGLSAFVDAAAGRRAALAQGWIWALAYFLYLPYTVTFVVYDLLAPVFPGIAPYRGALEVILPVALVAIALAPLRPVLLGIGILAIAQLGAMLLLAWVVHEHVGRQVATQPDLHGTGRAAASTALLFFCASLPLYLGREVHGGSRTVRSGLVAAVAIVGAVFLVSAIPLAGIPAELANAPVPGAAAAQVYSGRALAVVVGLLTAASTLALIVAEYLALARLLHWLHGPPVRSVLRWIAAPFIALDVVSLVDPERFYADLLDVSLGALFVSQLVVFLVFPRFQRGFPAIAAASIASGLAVWGLYTLVVSGGST
jgi:hypothetical protein